MRDPFDSPERQHLFDLLPNLRPRFLLQEFPHRERKHIADATLPPDPPIDDRVGSRFSDIDEADGTLLVDFELSHEAVGGKRREGRAGADELGRVVDEVFRVAARQGFERLAEKDDALRWERGGGGEG